jgi:predicted transposase YdaD
MQITVSLLVDIPASADINEIEQRVQEAGRQAMREATRKAMRAAEGQRKTCPHCGSEVSRSEGTDQRIILTGLMATSGAYGLLVLETYSSGVI